MSGFIYITQEWVYNLFMRKGNLIDSPRKLLVVIFLEAVVAVLGCWLALRFLPTDKAISLNNAIVILFLFAAGITVIVYGNVRKNRNFYILGFAFWLIAVFEVIDKYEGFAVKISAFATLIMAFAAFVSIYVSIEENRRIRQDSIGRESRDRKERLVDEVAKWLRELEGNVLFKPREIASGAEDLMRRIGRDPKISPKTWLQMENIDRALGEVNALAKGIKEAEYYQKLTLELNEELSSLIEVIANNLKERRQLYVEGARYQPDYVVEATKIQLVKELVDNDDRPLEDLGLSEQDIIIVHFGRNANAIRKSILKAVEKAIDLKGSLIRVS